MKKLFIIICYFIFYSASGQIFSISADKNNILYLGVDNPITIAVENYSANEISVKVDNGELLGGYGRTYVYRGSKPGIVTFTIYKKSNLQVIGRSMFRTKYIPTPIAKVGPSGGGDIEKVILENQQFIRADLENFDFDARLTVDSFTISIIRIDTCYFKQIKNIGNKFSNAVVEALKAIKKNDIVIFDKIYALGPDGRTIKLSPIIFNITEPAL